MAGQWRRRETILQLNRYPVVQTGHRWMIPFDTSVDLPIRRPASSSKGMPISIKLEDYIKQRNLLLLDFARSLQIELARSLAT